MTMLMMMTMMMIYRQMKVNELTGIVWGKETGGISDSRTPPKSLKMKNDVKSDFNQFSSYRRSFLKKKKWNCFRNFPATQTCLKCIVVLGFFYSSQFWEIFILDWCGDILHPNHHSPQDTINLNWHIHHKNCIKDLKIVLVNFYWRELWIRISSFLRKKF